MKNLSKFSGSLAVAAVILATSSEAAAGPLDFDRNNFFIISAERMFGFSYSSVKVETGDVTSTQKTTAFSLLTPAGGALSTPSIGLHYSVIPALTIGANLGLSRTSPSTTVETPKETKDTDGDPTTNLLFGPRVGYIFGFSNAFYLWARGGITYARSSTSSETTDATTGKVTASADTTTSIVALSLDPMFVVTPVNRFGIMFGPVFDVGLSASTKTESTVVSGSSSKTDSTTQDFSPLNIGLQFGLVGYI